MSSKLRWALPMALVGVVGAACLLLWQSHASARVHMNYTHLNKIQQRIVSETLATALGQQPKGAQPHITGPISGGGRGPDSPPRTRPRWSGSQSGARSTINYFPSSQGNCPASLGNDVKVNQNCLNLSDPDLQGYGQANNNPSIAVDPFNPWHLVASDTNYVRGDSTCGSYFSLDGGRTWSDTTVPNGFTDGPTGFARACSHAARSPYGSFELDAGHGYVVSSSLLRGTLAIYTPQLRLLRVVRVAPAAREVAVSSPA